MSWRHEDVLWALACLPVLAGLYLWAASRRRRAARAFGALATVSALVVGRPAGWRAARAVLVTLGVGLAVVAWAGPQYGSMTRILRRRGVDVVLAIDFSKSMLARDVRPSRIERAKVELAQFAQELDGDRIGIVAFAGDTMQFPMTLDYAAAGLFLRDLGPYDMPVGGTAIGRALAAARQLLERSTPAEARAGGSAPSRVVVLLTDGEDHEGDPLAVARELATANIKVFAVGIGSATGEPIPTYAPDGTWTGYVRDDEGRPVLTSLTPESEAQLREIANLSGGRYFRAEEGGVGMEAIRAEMRRMKQEERRARRVTVDEDRYALVLLPAFLLLLFESLLPEAWLARRRRRRVEPDAPDPGAAPRAGHGRRHAPLEAP